MRCIALIDNPDTSTDELMKIIKGPDFPTGGYIYGREGIKEAYETGRGRVRPRPRPDRGQEQRPPGDHHHRDPLSGQQEQAARGHRRAGAGQEDRGHLGLRDESDREGMRVVVELKRDAVAEVVLNQLYKHTSCRPPSA